jgi:predicted XRE-type DNA-binding protein
MEREKENIVERSQADVFHDLGLPDADELLAKSKLARAITSTMKARRLTQVQVAHLTGIPQPKISQLVNGKISGFSTDRLIHILNRMDQDVVIYIRPKPATESRSGNIDVSQSL